MNPTADAGGSGAAFRAARFYSRKIRTVVQPATS